MLPDTFPCELITWERAAALGRRLAQVVRESGYRPDLAVAIGRGGYVPARVLCDYLRYEMLTSIKIEHWGEAGEEKPETTVRFPLSIDVIGSRLLVVDDVTDTGDTLTAAVSYLRDCGAAEIRTAVLQHKGTSGFLPDYYAEIVTDWRWIIYPWAVYEDLSGFVLRILKKGPATPEEIVDDLTEDFSITADTRMFAEICADLFQRGEAELRDGKIQISGWGNLHHQ
ncbi:phosphoribosyltransferase [Methanogenium organophilum]|uniref:Phosphoribosyltransferase n=1 Tax=Methanogenium organophilum TaxID=2199 RepID=A0A9X9S6J2_METOG|nr:phosphoribosyltransferase [Methanogenium organophilum]WAI02340.1 phosphoribosyltransferase [Methanogenium organophilum]